MALRYPPSYDKDNLPVTNFATASIISASMSAFRTILIMLNLALGGPSS